MSSQFSTVSQQEAFKRKFQVGDTSTTYSPLTRNAILYGVISGALMSLFLGVSGFYITGENAGFGFLKYLILGAALVLLLNKTKATTPPGLVFKNGIVTGLIASVTAAIISAAAILLFNGRNALEGPLEGGADIMLNRGTLAGITFFETVVAGMILSFIMLQFLKGGKPAK